MKTEESQLDIEKTISKMKKTLEKKKFDFKFLQKNEIVYKAIKVKDTNCFVLSELSNKKENVNAQFNIGKFDEQKRMLRYTPIPVTFDYGVEACTSLNNTINDEREFFFIVEKDVKINWTKF